MGGVANGGVMMTPHFYKSSKGDEKDWGEGERAISEDAAAQVTSCMQTVVSRKARALAVRSMAMTWHGKDRYGRTC
ncbi:MAG: penicillin-binding transpeptidase domain-containing protein [Collinsella sp.]